MTAQSKRTEDLISKIDHCYAVANHGTTELAQKGLLKYTEQFCAENYKSKFNNPESILQSIQRTSHRIGVDVALESAEQFYEKGDRRAAREWLYYAKRHARPIKLDISESISDIKDKYKDRMPLLLFWKT